MGFPQVKNKKL